MDKLIRKAKELQKLNKIHGVTSTNEFAEVLQCLPLKFITNQLQKNFPKSIAVRNLFYQDDLRLSVYCLPKNIRMPIHDHPNMFVLGYILYGEMEADFYTKLTKGVYKKETKNLKKGDYMVIEGQKNNLHQFTGKTNTMFLDILFPDYDHINRVCTHYKQINVDIGKQTAKLQIDEEPDYQMVEF